MGAEHGPLQFQERDAPPPTLLQSVTRRLALCSESGKHNSDVRLGGVGAFEEQLQDMDMLDSDSYLLNVLPQPAWNQHKLAATSTVSDKFQAKTNMDESGAVPLCHHSSSEPPSSASV